ncbi:MAG TPA: hypothetical protein DCX06_13365 [Opitutae bacterium]|nr:hypothetical protein [Opitutae bacterium]
MTDAKPLPELHQNVLDSKTLAFFVADLKACAEILVVMPKAGPGYVAPKEIDLEEGARLLEAADLRGLQIRYRYQNAEWWDTLINRDGNIHITRIQQDFSS